MEGDTYLTFLPKFLTGNLNGNQSTQVYGFCLCRSPYFCASILCLEVGRHCKWAKMANEKLTPDFHFEMENNAKYL